MEHPYKHVARDLLRRYDLSGATAVATAAIDTQKNPWPYRLVLLEVQRLKGQRAEALQELEHLAEVDPPLPEDAESCVCIEKLRGYYSGLLGRYKASH